MHASKTAMYLAAASMFIMWPCVSLSVAAVSIFPCGHASLQGMAFPKRAKPITDIIMATMSELEKAKPSLVLDPESDKFHCEGFAQKIFNNADRTDRAGKATENTSKAFYAAALFLGVRVFQDRQTFTF